MPAPPRAHPLGINSLKAWAEARSTVLTKNKDSASSVEKKRRYCTCARYTRREICDRSILGSLRLRADSARAADRRITGVPDDSPARTRRGRRNESPLPVANALRAGPPHKRKGGAEAPPITRSSPKGDQFACAWTGAPGPWQMLQLSPKPGTVLAVKCDCDCRLLWQEPQAPVAGP